jgi:hypothetical protein
MSKLLLIIPDKMKCSLYNIPSYRLFYVTLGVFLTLPCFFGTGASPNVQRKDDLWTPLFVAAMLGRTQVANMLLQVSFLQGIKQKKIILINLFKKNNCYSPELTHCWRTVRDGQRRPLPESSGTSALLTSSPGQPRPQTEPIFMLASIDQELQHC